MSQKRFGPVNDAGVVIQEAEGEKTIGPSLLGPAAMTGVLERGPVNELITVIRKKDLNEYKDILNSDVEVNIDLIDFKYFPETLNKKTFLALKPLIKKDE